MKSLKLAAALAILATGLMAAECENKSQVIRLAQLPKDVPAYYVECFAKGAKIPADKKTFTVTELKMYFAEFVASDAAHTECGKQLIAWYRKLAKAYNR